MREFSVVKRDTGFLTKTDCGRKAADGTSPSSDHVTTGENGQWLDREIPTVTFTLKDTSLLKDSEHAGALEAIVKT